MSVLDVLSQTDGEWLEEMRSLRRGLKGEPISPTVLSDAFTLLTLFQKHDISLVYYAVTEDGDIVFHFLPENKSQITILLAVNKVGYVLDVLGDSLTSRTSYFTRHNIEQLIPWLYILQ